MLTRKIAFTKKLPSPNRYADIYTLEPGGSPVRITAGSDAIPQYDSAGADWSADGAWLVFDSSRDTNPNSEIYKVEIADLSNVVRLTDTDGNDAPNWSLADGRILFDSERNGTYGPFVMDSDGSNQIELFPGNTREILFPKWSFGGDKLVCLEEFTRLDTRVFRADIGGLNKHYLTSLNRDGSPCFSPPLGGSNTEKIVFSRMVMSGGQPDKQDLWTINLDGSGLTNLTNAASGTLNDYPDWSAAGTHIVFSRKVGSGTFQIYELEVSSSNTEQITNDTDYDHFAPSYSP